MEMRGHRSIEMAPVIRRLSRHSPIDRRDTRWLALALFPSLVAVAVYLTTNPYPAYGAGLYTKIAEEIVAGGYRPPVHIPGYTAEGVPFAYPPLQFYAMAVFLDLGVEPLSLSRFGPVLAVVVAQVPLYLLTRDLTDSRPAGAVAPVLFVAVPQAVKWHISAGGIVRGYAFFYALIAVYAGYHVFASRRRTPVVLGTLAFGVTVLTHPTYSLFVVVSYFLLWAVTDRSTVGFVRGAAVGTGGLLVSSPWFLWIHATHGITTLTAAAGTHGGIGGGLEDVFVDPSIPAVLAGILVVVLVFRGHRFIPAWIGISLVVFAQPRFAGVTMAVGAAALVAATLESGDRKRTVPEYEPIVMTGLLVLASVTGGVYYAHEMTQSSDSLTPSFLDDEDINAMEWVERETASDATFVVMGDAAEEFPAHTGRTILVGPWGVEWTTPAAYDRHLDGFETVSTCHSVGCVMGVTEDIGERPGYVYVPKGQYTVRGENAVQFGTIERSFERSDDWKLVMENDGVVIYRSNPP